MFARFLAIFALLAANGFFVAAEFALVRSRRTRLESMARSGDRKARTVLRALGNLGRSLSAAQLGISLCSLALGALTYDLVAFYMDGWLGRLPISLGISLRVALASILAILVVAFVHVVFGELTPRAFSLANPERVIRWLAAPLLGFAWLTTPLTALINWSARVTRGALGLKVEVSDEVVHSAEELRTLVEQSEETGMLGEQDATLIEGVFDFREKSAREVMTPRTEIDALPLQSTLEETATVVEESQRSRYPVYDETIDNIVGVVLAKDLLPLLHRPPVSFTLRSVARPIHLVPGSRAVVEVLGDFKRLKVHMAVVLDEYGGTAGLVTMEDLLEEIVGDILDEHDEPDEPEIPDMGEDVCVAGSMHITDLNDRFALEVPEDEYTTIGGYIFGTLGRLPSIGDRVTAGGALFTVREMDGRRVESLSVDLHSLGDRRERVREVGEQEV